MTFEELVRAFETHTGTEGEIDNAQLAVWMNEAQVDLSFYFGKVVHFSFEVQKGVPVSLPSDLLNIVSSCADYAILPDKTIVFTGDGDHAIYYRRLATPFSGTETDQVSELEPYVHYLLPMWAAARYWTMESEGDHEEMNEVNVWMNSYQQGKAQAARRALSPADQLTQWAVI